MAKLITAVALVAKVSAQGNLSSAVEGIVYIIRHGEKDSKGCESDQGMTRANNMFDVFSKKFDVPGYVFAYTYEGTESWECQRCEQTARPIANKIGMSPDTTYGTDDCSCSHWGQCTVYANAVMDKLSTHDVVMVVAEHQHIPYIAYGLGASQSEIPDWSGRDYDTVFKLKYSGGKVTFSVDKQGQFGPAPAPPPVPSGSDTIAPDERLEAGASLVSVGGSARLSVQASDGNMVLHHGSTVVWASGTTGHPGAELRFQTDGNLVLYDGSHPLWASGNKPGAASVQLQDDCDLVMKDSSGAALWSLGTSCSGAVTV